MVEDTGELILGIKHSIAELRNDKDLPYLSDDNFCWVVMCLGGKSHS